jgi:hypothetical protein
MIAWLYADNAERTHPGVPRRRVRRVSGRRCLSQRLQKTLINAQMRVLGDMVVLDGGFYTFPCPHCGLLIAVKCDEINCGIFRHAAYKSDMSQIDPHASKLTCDTLKAQDKVYGCAKPYEMIHDGTSWSVRECGYM